MIIKRSIVKNIRSLLGKYPIVGVTGPRQSGKTTMIREEFSDYSYVSLEHPDVARLVTKDPNAFFELHTGKLIIDEAQKVPELFSWLQVKVDEERIMGRFIISGSQSFQLLRTIQQSLAGRIAMFDLLTLDMTELKQYGVDEDYAERIVQGTYPAIFDRDISPRFFYPSYIKSYVERDVPDVLNVRDMNQFRVFIKLCAHRVGSILELSSLASDAGISVPTVKSWISVLESSYLTFRLHPFFKNFDKRVTKSPKIFFYDTGLLCHLLGIKSKDALLMHKYKGHVFENYVISELLKCKLHNQVDTEFWFWRNTYGNEVDLLMEEGDKLRLFEIKSSQSVQSDMFKGLNYLESKAKGYTIEKNLIYGGLDSYKLRDTQVVSWKDIPSLF